MRGTRLALAVQIDGLGIIPAYAGNTLKDTERYTVERDHPRVCGEHALIHHVEREGQGSSPRMRGTRIRARNRRQRMGIIPAYAGNTRSAW